MKNYLYDGSFEGFLTAIFYAYQDKESSLITREINYIPHLLYEPIKVNVEQDKFKRVYTSIQTKLSTAILSTVYYLYLSELKGFENLCLDYLKLCYRYGESINLAKNNDTIIQVDSFRRRVTLEVHRFNGFVRFKEISPKYFYAQIEPDHNILPLLSEHFIKRFSDQYFIIHDLKRKTALVYNQEEVYLQQLSLQQSNALASNNIIDPFQDLFKSYYDSTTIKERKNPKLQRSFVPKRYWKHLAEMCTLD
ncbi:TIGR03915 family putative DNA repair protein [Zhenhengia sp.]|uniref:TIGR03915 family putative DNA repair protein n=1 Tax=Zhenhengia sp. TaxID=2944208 RepID=UPI0030797ABC